MFLSAHSICFSLSCPHTLTRPHTCMCVCVYVCCLTRTGVCREGEASVEVVGSVLWLVGGVAGVACCVVQHCPGLAKRDRRTVGAAHLVFVSLVLLFCVNVRFF